MKCAICKHGETQAGLTTIVLEKNETILVFKQVPAQICDNCGEEYISSQTNKEILEKAKYEINKGISLELLNFKASLEPMPLPLTI
jgi:YgiT-type zinc finger domain-containing protein